MIPWALPTRNPARQILSPEDGQAAGLPAPRPMRADARARLLIAVAKARLWVEQLASGEALDTSAIATREGCSERSVRMTLGLAFLAPQVVTVIEKGSVRKAVGLTN